MVRTFWWRGTGAGSLGVYGLGGVQEMGEEREGSGSSKGSGSEREMQNANCLYLLMR